jgi:hypothetical protein
VESLFEGLEGTLSLGVVTLEALVSLVAAALSGFGVFFSVSLSLGHGDLLHTMIIATHGLKDTLVHSISHGKLQSEKAVPQERSVAISPVE